MKITVVTVCYNAEMTIDDTIKSVIDQTYLNIEYLIIDGKSQDNTVKIVEKYLNDNRVTLISEKDSGLYNAMNKGLSLSTGDYILYLNSGDIFADEKVVEDIIPFLQADLVYGNVLRKKQDGQILEKYHGKFKLMTLLLMGKMMSHQSLFVRTDIMKLLKFDEQYRITADYDFVVRAKKKKYTIKYVDRTVSIVDNVDGVSSRIENNDIMRKEDDQSLKSNFPVWYYIIKFPKGIVRFIRRINEKRG